MRVSGSGWGLPRSDETLPFADWARANLPAFHVGYLDELQRLLGHIPDIDRRLDPQDHMVLKNVPGYFGTAVTGLVAILASLEAAGRRPADIGTILDFGSGYGRIYRAIAAAFPHAQLTALDLMEDAARYCAETFGGDWVRSAEDLSRVTLPRRYDLIWFGSVFTHLPLAQWDSFLTFLASATAPGGTVVFTTHGWNAFDQIARKHERGERRAVAPEDLQHVRDNLEELGFIFVPGRSGEIRHQQSRGIDVTEGQYGRSFSTEAWVRSYIESLPGWQLIDFVPGGWGNNHDVVTITPR